MPVKPHPSPMDRIPPPLLFVGSFLLGWWAQRALWPVERPLPAALAAAGAVLLAGGLAMSLPAIVLFATARTSIVPHREPARLVVRGPFRVTRNPMYVGLCVAYLGAAVWTRAWLAVPLLAIPVAALARWVIPAEESQMRARFGADYQAYCARVRRWL